MTVDDYVAEDGRGIYSAAHVPDLVPRGQTDVGLLLVLESPHVEELRAGTPVVGVAGRSALKFLAPSRNGESLGSFVKSRHAVGDYRIAVMNVSNVPLQKAAFAGRVEPGLVTGDWDALWRVRTSSARTVDGTQSLAANRLGVALLAGLQARFDALTLTPSSSVVAAGGCSHRFTRALTGLQSAPLEVFHPSYGLWWRHPNRPAHTRLRSLFELYT